ncbi:MAG: hypothetical protein K6D97_04570 [Clostridia bacterium]|nr:hypothetical protein [Clostridia bacterium]
MKIKNLIIVCIILIVVLFGAIMFISRNAAQPTDEEAVDVEEIEEELGDIEVLIKNSTGKKINTLYMYQDGNEEYIDEDGNQKWIELIDNKTFDVDEEGKATIERIEQGGDWDFKIETDDGEYEMKETLGEDFVYDNATLNFIIVDGHLDVVDDGSTADDFVDEDDEEEQEQEQEDIDDEENTGDEEESNTVNTEEE